MLNKKIAFLLLLVVLSVALLISCGNTVETNGTADTNETESTGSDTSDQITDGISKVDKDSVKIYSISELNLEQGTADSHKGLEKYSSLELNNREYRQLTSRDLGGINVPFYSRVRQTKDGKYIMTYQSGRISSEVYVAFSDDGVRWRNSGSIFTRCDYPDGYKDTMLFMTADLCVLDDGTIVVVCAFRGKENYRNDVNSNGLVVIRSTDNGATWSEMQMIYRGTAWEPYIMQTKSGEVQVYFTQTGHLLAIHPFMEDRRSSCVALLRSGDRGLTFTEAVDHSAQIVMQQFIFNRDGYDYMCDQMPCAVELNNGKIALVAETCDANEKYKISVAYSSDNWAKSLAFNEVGPTDRITNFMGSAGPYLVQMLSGECVLSVHTTGMSTYIGSSEARGFTNQYTPFGDHEGLWASLYADSSHSVIGTMANIISGETKSPTSTTLDIGRMYLNHAIYANSSEKTVDGKNDDWSSDTQALFIGSETQAQMSMRFAYDDQRVYFLIERLDEYLTSSDVEGIFVPGEGKSYYLIKFGVNGIDSVQYNDGERMKNAEFEGVQWAMTLVGGVDDKDRDTGKILELSIPRDKVVITDGMLSFNAILYNRDKNERAVSDTFSCVDTVDRQSWQRVYLTK